MDDPELRSIEAQELKHHPHLRLGLGKEGRVLWREESCHRARLVGGHRGEQAIGIPAGEVKVWRGDEVLRVEVQTPQHLAKLGYCTRAKVGGATAGGAVQPG